MRAGWAHKTLAEHAGDPRKLYSETKWKMPRQKIRCGMRPRADGVPAGCTTTCACTGPRKSWSGAGPRGSLSLCRLLNDKYFLDGRDRTAMPGSPGPLSASMTVHGLTGLSSARSAICLSTARQKSLTANAIWRRWSRWMQELRRQTSSAGGNVVEEPVVIRSFQLPLKSNCTIP